MTAQQDGYDDNYGVASRVLDHFDADEQKRILATFPQVAVSGSGTFQQDVVIHRAAAISGRVTMDSGGLPGRFQIGTILVSTSLFGDTPEKDKQHPSPRIEDWVSGDDRGFYRIAGLPPGKYEVQIHVMENFENPERIGTGSLHVYAPEALEEQEARVIDLGVGDEINDVDVNIPTRLLHSISGTVTQGGAPVDKSHIVIHRQGEKESCECGATTDVDGNYRIDLIPAGTYTLEASAPSRTRGSDHGRRVKLTLLLESSDLTGANIDLNAPVQSH